MDGIGRPHFPWDHEWMICRFHVKAVSRVYCLNTVLSNQTINWLVFNHHLPVRFDILLSPKIFRLCEDFLAYIISTSTKFIWMDFPAYRYDVDLRDFGEEWDLSNCSMRAATILNHWYLCRRFAGSSYWPVTIQIVWQVSDSKFAGFFSNYILTFGNGCTISLNRTGKRTEKLHGLVRKMEIW